MIIYIFFYSCLMGPTSWWRCLYGGLYYQMLRRDSRLLPRSNFILFCCMTHWDQKIPASERITFASDAGGNSLLLITHYILVHQLLAFFKTYSKSENIILQTQVSFASYRTYAVTSVMSQYFQIAYTDVCFVTSLHVASSQRISRRIQAFYAINLLCSEGQSEKGYLYNTALK